VYISSYPFTDNTQGEDWCDHKDEDGIGHGPDEIYHVPANDELIKAYHGLCPPFWFDGQWCVGEVLDALAAGGVDLKGDDDWSILGKFAVWDLQQALQDAGYKPQKHPCPEVECD
jgi:hypothetical protein